MVLTPVEGERRRHAFQNILREYRLQAILLIGETTVGSGVFGDLRYYTNSQTIFYRQVALVFAQSEPVLFAGEAVQTEAAVRQSFIRDCRRISCNLASDLVDLLRERDISTGRIGISMEMLPAAWYIYFRQHFPQIEWVEIHDAIMKVRFERSAEEIEILRKGTSLGDGAFEAALQFIKPGVSEYEIVAQIEHYARKCGAEEQFTLIASGEFVLGEGNTFPLVHSPSERIIEARDRVTLEISPRYNGYWSQLVRSINVGVPNRDLEKVHRVCRDALNRGLEKLSPGKAIRDLVLIMDRYVTNCGYVLKLPLGHVCGVDLVEARVSSDNEIVLIPGMTVVLHPTVSTSDEKSSFFEGETYLVRKDGYERLNRAGDELAIVR